MTPSRPAREARADALMQTLHREAAGRLTVFLGAAPGVGKTYAMLQRARDLQRQGTPVVVGVVETHGRSDTQALLQGLTVIPRRSLVYRHRRLEEMDLDALLKDRPPLVLVDELAHRNAPGSRHERRWQDVMELLDAGIDVYTTVNIQHLESLNDVVWRITGVRVSETVPDGVFDRLRDIRLVDLAPSELIERLQQGKVYWPDQAEQALQAFFAPSNLAALRELAMQTVADQVDADLRESHTARGQPALALRRHVLVVIDGQAQCESIVRMGRRIAERRGAPWTVVTVETAQTTADTAHARVLAIDKAFALARQLGGDTAVLHGDDVVRALLDAAATRGANAFVIGRSTERGLARLWRSNLTQQLLARGGQYELTIVPTPPQGIGLPRPTPVSGLSFSGREGLWMVWASSVATGAAAGGEYFWGLTDVSMIFVLTVLLVASRTRTAAALSTAVLCFASYNFFFIEPRFTLEIGTFPGVVTALIFLGTVLVVGQLASRLRAQVLALRAANAHATAMQTLGQELSSAADPGQVVQAGEKVLASVMTAQAWIHLGETLPVQPELIMTDKDHFAAQWSLQHQQAAGRFTDTLSSSPWWFLPLKGARGAVGVAGLKFPESIKHLSFERRRMAESLVHDIAQAAVRTRLVADLEAARISEATERLRSALLSSVSHDLRSPLSSMIGAADSLMHYGHAMGTEDSQALLQTIGQEGHRLDRYIQNLLDMTRLGQQGLTLTRDWIGVDELIGSALSRLQRYVSGLRCEMDLPSDLPLIHVHPALLEQAIFNILENAEKFSPPGQAIHIRVRRQDDELHLSITDSGPGIPQAERERIFNMFYSVERGDRKRQGSGLGLAIVQAIVGAHMGHVEALEGPQGRGTLIHMVLPWAELPPSMPPHDASGHDGA